MTSETIREGFDMFVHDGDGTFGAVREVSSHGLVVYVENAGDFRVPLSAAQGGHSEKVILNCAKPDLPLRRAIGHAYEGEEPRI
jgi:hypothetical protein